MSCITQRMPEMRNSLSEPIQGMIKQGLAKKLPFSEHLYDWLMGLLRDIDPGKCVAHISTMDKGPESFSQRFVMFVKGVKEGMEKEEAQGGVEAGAEDKGEMRMSVKEVELASRITVFYTNWLNETYVFSEEEKKDFGENLQLFVINHLQAATPQVFEERLLTPDRDIASLLMAAHEEHQQAEVQERLRAQAEVQTRLVVSFVESLDREKDAWYLHSICQWGRFMQTISKCVGVLERVVTLNPMALSLAHILNSALDGTVFNILTELGPSCHTHAVR
jgi:hypothetical protein